MESKAKYATVRQVQYIKDRMFEMEQKLNANLAKVEQLKAAFAASIERVADKIAAYNNVAERVNAIIGVCEQASVGLSTDEAPALPQRLPILNRKDFGA